MTVDANGSMRKIASRDPKSHGHHGKPKELDFQHSGGARPYKREEIRPDRQDFQYIGGAKPYKREEDDVQGGSGGEDAEATSQTAEDQDGGEGAVEEGGGDGDAEALSEDDEQGQEQAGEVDDEAGNGEEDAEARE